MIINYVEIIVFCNVVILVIKNYDKGLSRNSRESLGGGGGSAKNSRKLMRGRGVGQNSREFLV